MQGLQSLIKSIKRRISFTLVQFLISWVRVAYYSFSSIQIASIVQWCLFLDCPLLSQQLSPVGYKAFRLSLVSALSKGNEFLTLSALLKFLTVQTTSFSSKLNTF